MMPRHSIRFALPQAAHDDGSPGGGGAEPLTDAQLQYAIDETRKLAQTLLDASGIPGLALGIVQGDTTVFTAGYGLRELGKPDLIDENTVFPLASVSKSIGATVVAHQVGAGLVGWDSKMRESWSNFTLSNAAATHELTIGDFYAHRSGLPEHTADVLDIIGYNIIAIETNLQQVPLNGFRTQFAYTNTGLACAAYAVAMRTTSQPWSALSQSVLYDPLGMSRTTSTFEQFNTMENRAASHMKVAGGYAPFSLRNTDTLAPAGGAASSVTDLSKWMSMLLGNGSVNGQPIIANPDLALAPALEPHMQMPPPPTLPDGKPSGLPKTSYGYGFMINEAEDGFVTYGHSGDFVPGASTTFWFSRDLNVGIVVLTNATPIGVPQAIAYSFMDYVRSKKVPDNGGWWGILEPIYAQATSPKGFYAGAEPPDPPVPSQPLSAYTGDFYSPYYGHLFVNEKAGTLQIFAGISTLILNCTHWSGDSFAATLPDTLTPIGSAFRVAFSGTPPQILVCDFFDEVGVNIFARYTPSS